MRKNISKVIQAFQAGKGFFDKTCSTDGNRIFSYRMQIAERLEDGSVSIVSESESPSKTTTTHIRAVSLVFG